MWLIHRFGFLVVLSALGFGAVAGCVVNPYRIDPETDAGMVCRLSGGATSDRGHSGNS